MVELLTYQREEQPSRCSDDACLLLMCLMLIKDDFGAQG